MEVDGSAGLTDVLIGRASLEDVAQPWGRGNLVVLPAGQIPPNRRSCSARRPCRTSSRRSRPVRLRAVRDAPPLLPVTDAAILSKKASGAILAVASGKTHKGQLAAAFASLENVGAPIAGFVITMMPVRGPVRTATAATVRLRYGLDEAAHPPDTKAPKRRVGSSARCAGRPLRPGDDMRAGRGPEASAVI